MMARCYSALDLLVTLRVAMEVDALVLKLEFFLVATQLLFHLSSGYFFLQHFTTKLKSSLDH